MRAVGPLAALLALGAGLGACASSRPPDPRYRPAENLLEVVAVLRQHVPDDTYRFEPARDFTGRNIYRASLLRLENIEQAYAEGLQAGHMDDVIAFSKGRALERLRAFDLAAASYHRAAEREGELAQEARRSASICDSLDEAARIGFDADRPDDASGAKAAAVPRDAPSVVEASQQRTALLEALQAETTGTHYEAVIREEIERAEMARARYFVATRRSTPDGDVRALAELQQLVVHNQDSKLRSRHMLELADLYATLAEEYVVKHPPEGLLFDPASFQELVDSAARLYEAVGKQDGTPEKLEASRRLEAFLAFTLRVDRDRFTQ
ncbi:MAG TPA: hypothetical protein VK714_13205 [Myxococcota bacterium]|nr:hypothetical protein [Myxococcota bacterium]